MENTAPIENTEVLKKEMNYAGFGIRLSAFIIDTIIYMTIAYLIWGNQVVNTSNGGVYVGLKNEQMIIPLLYFFLSWISFSSSIGKLVFRLKIVTADGKRIKIKEVLLRLLVYIVMLIGVWFILGNKKKQALHDIVAKTFVIIDK